MTRDKGREVSISERAAGEVLEHQNKIHCISCRDAFVIEDLGKHESWRCPHCRKLNPNLRTVFHAVGALVALGILANLALLVLYIGRMGRGINIFCMMWASAHTLVSGYVLIAMFGDKHSYSLKPLRYLIPIVFVSSAASIFAYQAPLTSTNVIIACAALGAAAAFVGYAFYVSVRMADAHKAEESIVRPLYSTISITLNVLLLALLTTVAVKYTVLAPGNSTVSFGPAAHRVNEDMQTQKVDKDVAPVEPEETEMPVIDPDPIDIDPQVKIPPSIEVVADKKREHLRRPEAKPKIKPKPGKEAKGTYSGRTDRTRMLREAGGCDATEYAVVLALEWLKKHQNADGSWGTDPYRPSMTGFALLCFLGHGEDHLSEKYGAVVRGAISWIVDSQDQDGYFADTNRGYQHGIVTYALAEAYGMCQLEDLEASVEQAVSNIVKGQTECGSWVYGYAHDVEGRTTDMSVAGWQIQALKAAHSAGIADPKGKRKAAMEKAVEYIKASYSEQNQTFGYNGKGVSWEEEYAMTGTGALCMEFLGQYDAPEVRAALAQMKKNYVFDWGETKGGRSSVPLYAWYYATQSFFQSGDVPARNEYWIWWNVQMQKTLLPKQERDGSWPLPDKSKAADHLHGEKNADVWSTCFCCLMLEVYYRYLPTYRLAGF